MRARCGSAEGSAIAGPLATDSVQLNNEETSVRVDGAGSVGDGTLVGARTVEEDGVEGNPTVDGGGIVEGGLVPSGLRITAGLTTAVRMSADLSVLSN